MMTTLAPPEIEAELVMTNSVKFVAVHVYAAPLIVTLHVVDVTSMLLGMSTNIHPVPDAYKVFIVVKLTTNSQALDPVILGHELLVVVDIEVYGFGMRVIVFEIDPDPMS